MKKVTKGLSICVALAMSIGIFAGCAKTQDAPKPTEQAKPAEQAKSAEQPKEEKKVKLIFSRNKDSTDSSIKTIEAFQKKYPNIEVEYQPTPSSVDQAHNQYVTALSAQDSTYDIFALDVIWIPEFAAAKWVIPLDDKVNKDDFLAGPIEGATYQGKLYAVPFYTDAGLIYYRKDIINEAPKTWDDLIKVAKENMGKNDTKYGYVFQAKQYEGMVCDALELIHTYGGKVLDENGKVVINSPEALAGLKKFAELVNSGIAPEGVTTYMETETQNVFLEGHSVLARNWPYMYSNVQKDDSKVKDKVAVAPLPSTPDGKPGQSVLGGRSMAVSAFSKYKEEAWKFVEFATGEEGQRLQTIVAGRYPGRKSTYKDPEVLKAVPHITMFETVFQNIKPRPVSPVYPAISDVMQIYFHKAITGAITPEEALKTVQAELEKIVK